MYTSIRYFYPHGIEGEEMDNTVKEFESIDKAIAYAHRYATGIRFAGVEIEDENGNTLYEILSDGTVIDNRQKEIENKEDNSINAVLDKIDTGIITYPKLRKNTDDGSVELILLDENKNKTQYEGNFEDLRSGIEKLAELNLKGKYYVWTSWQANTRNQWYIPIEF